MPITESLKLIGLQTDKPPFDTPPDAWTFMQNIEIASGITRRARGHLAVFGDSLHVSRWHSPLSTPFGDFWVYVGDALVSQTTGVGAHTDLTGALTFDSTGDKDPITGGVVNGNLVFNNQDGVPAFWKPPANDALPLPDWPVDRRAGAMGVFRDFLVAMNITNGIAQFPEQLLWSDAAPVGDVPQSWTPGDQSLAGDASAAYKPGPIVDGLAFRDQLFLYKTHSTFVLQLIGGALVMQTRPVFPTTGVLAKNCVAEYRGSHFVLTDGDVIVHNGVEAHSIIQNRVRRTIFNNMDPDNFANSYVALDKENAQLWVCVPRQGDTFPTIAAIYNIRDDAWAVRELEIAGRAQTPYVAPGIVIVAEPEATWQERTSTWRTDTTTWAFGGSSAIEERLLMSDDAPQFHAVGLSEQFDGQSPQVTLRRLGLDFGEPDTVKFCSRIWPKIQGSTGSVIRIRAGGSLGADDPVLWGPFQDYTLGAAGDNFVGAEASGRFLAFEFNSDANSAWRITGFDVELGALGNF